MMNVELQGLGLPALSREGSKSLYGPDLMTCIFGSSADGDDDENKVLLDQQLGSRLPPGWEQCLDLKSGELFYKNLSTGSTTHVDPRTAFGALERNSGVNSSSIRCLSWENDNTLIQANSNVKAPGAISPYYQHGYGYGQHGYTSIGQAEDRCSGESVFADVDLDLRLSSSLHINHNSQPTSPSSSSSLSLASCNYTLHTNSQHSCISDAMCVGSNIINCPNTVNHGHADHSKRSGSVLSSTISSPSMPSAVRDWCRCTLELDSDDENGNEPNASTTMATAACMRCLMFVLIGTSKNESMRCPLCGCEAMKPLNCL
ncbi:hypothetical protein GOP47_0022808 [Adiantum capillus-veneris]|uniref:WW domain-containing protein n=1 Tax=Adiantum capillus-veneris TaxID=13818 RepID=A0A9D4U634_ADICA|nr:hypothetical protein GOP47_0022808 [Adiantum capillus-veneris]